MKEFYKKSYFIFLVILSVSCEKDLDLQPKDNIGKQQFFSTESEFKLYANSLYEQLKGFGTIHTDNWSEIVHANSNGISNSQRTLPNNSRFWNGPYADARKCLELIEAAKKPKAKDLKIDAYVGEAHFFLAQAYYNLYRYFGGVPMVTKVQGKDDDLYLPRETRENTLKYVIDNLDTAISKLPETVASADNGRLVKDAARSFKARVCLFAGTWRKYHLNGTGADAMLDEAIKESKAVIDGNKYSLFKNTSIQTNGSFDTVANYYYLFSLENYTKTNVWGVNKNANKEFILQVKYHREDKILFLSIPSNTNSYTNAFVSQILDINGLPIDNANSVFQTDKANHGYSFKYVDKMIDGKNRKVANNIEFNDRDPRMSAIIAKPMSQIWLQRHSYPRDFSKTTERRAGKEDAEKGTGFMYAQYYESTTGYLNIKFNNEARSSSGEENAKGMNYPVIRLAEVLLIYAEAKFEKDGSISDADLDLSINMLRDRVGMPKLTTAFVTTNNLNMKTEIRRERMVELAGEGFRYDDIRRWKIAENVLPKDALGIQWEDNPNNPNHPDNAANKDKGYKYFHWIDWKDTIGTEKKNYNLNSEGFVIVEDASSRSGFNPTRDYLFPIPTNEIEKYKKNNKTLAQNPGW